MQKYDRIFVIVMDSLGVGPMADSPEYGDLDVNTLGHISEAVDGLDIPNMQKLGVANLIPLKGVPAVENPLGYYAKLNEKSIGKDTMTGHWEMMGLEITSPFQTFTETGFPPELIAELEARTGRKVIGNKSASGTEILDECAVDEIEKGHLIVYTSADSVLQIAANEEIIPLEELYRICEYARKITIENKEWQVGRIIARPYIGKTKDTFKRTTNRHDYALKPFDKTALNFLEEEGFDTIAIGKINDIFDGYGVSKAIRTTSNHDGMLKTIEVAKTDFNGLCFVNLVDFDALYGHRRDLEGYKNAIEEFDNDLNDLLNVITEEDLIMVTADHGNDPVHHGTDHTRENVPLICYHKNIKGNILQDADSFATVAATICENFKVKSPKIGKSILEEL